MPKSKQTLIKIDDTVKSIITKGHALTITDDQTLTTATELLSQANIALKEYTAQKKAELEPYETPAKLIKVRYEPNEKSLKALIEDIRLQVSRYQTEAVNRRLVEEQAIADRIGDGKGKLKIETAVKKIENLDDPAEKVLAESGSLTFRAKPTVKIVDASLIPREYLVPDENHILAALQGGVEVPGCAIEIVQVPISRTK